MSMLSVFMGKIVLKELKWFLLSFKGTRKDPIFLEIETLLEVEEMWEIFDVFAGSFD